MNVSPSYWELTSFHAPFDILIIGGGIVGCSAALHCAQKNPSLRIGIIERGSLPTGASTRNAGFASFGSLSEIYCDLESMGDAATLELIIKRKTGFDRLLHLITPEKMDYQKTGGYEVFLEKDEDMYVKCLSMMHILNDFLLDHFGGHVFMPADWIAGQMKLRDIAHVIAHPFEGMLHPGKMMQQFIWQVQQAGVSLINGFNVERLIQEDQRAVVVGKDGLRLNARYLIVATNAFAGQLVPNLPLRPARNQVYVSQPIPGLRLRGCFHYDRGFIYFRDVDGRILIGGARNTDFANENTSEFGLTESIRNHLSDFLSRHVISDTPLNLEYAWSGIIGIGEEKAPIVKMVDERIAVAVRLNGIGVAIGSLVGEMAADLILARL